MCLDIMNLAVFEKTDVRKKIGRNDLFGNVRRYYLYFGYSTLKNGWLTVEEVILSLKDARSISLYTYNRSQILQNVKYT